jgi:2-succinyl-5-enolpyruvyl-6-hydroxy-3-cyclohexene-1-carboxylate synthase
VTHEEVLGAFVGAFVDELAHAGVRHAGVSPGSRSTPLALALARHPGIRLWMQYDERSSAFFGLGLAKASREPVALVCTSGSAAANFFPAIVEARYGHVPLVVLTADRPPELRENGAPQTIDQVKLYGEHVKWAFDVPLPEASDDALRFVRALAARAAATARATPSGPVHLNMPFREPLVPAFPALTAAATVAVFAAPRTADAALVEQVAERLAARERGLILCGPQDDPALAPAVAALAAAAGFPVLADPLSGVRAGSHDRSLVVDAYDAFLRAVAMPGPEVVVRFGAMPTSKPVLQYLQAHPSAEQIVVDGAGGWQEPTSLAGVHVWADGARLAEAVAGRIGRDRRGAWSERWLAANRAARCAIAETLTGIDEPFEGRVFAELADLLPDGATLWAGSSMPVRDLDTFFPSTGKRIRLLSNRGTNGIDGVVSSALGASVASEGPLVLAIGDLSLYHDMNGLLAAKLHRLDATIVLLNNDGGGIFSFLPQAALTEQFELLWGTPHGLDFRPAIEMYGGRFQDTTAWGAFRSAVCASLARPGLDVVQLRTDRRRNVELHRRFWPAVAAAVEGIR